MEKRTSERKGVWLEKSQKKNIATIVDGALGIIYNESSINLTCSNSD